MVYDVCNKHLKIHNYLGNIRFRKCQIIKINWIYYYNIHNNLYYKNKPIQKRIKEKTRVSSIIKSTVKGKLSNNYWLKANNPHTNSFYKFICCTGSGKKIYYKSEFIIPPDIKYAYLKHYHFKSFEEYCYKIKRGKADSFNKRLKFRIIKIYENNKNNVDKLKIMKKIFNIDSII